MTAAVASYALFPELGHLVMPFKVLVIMLLMLAFLPVCQSQVNLIRNPIDTNQLDFLQVTHISRKVSPARVCVAATALSQHRLPACHHHSTLRMPLSRWPATSTLWSVVGTPIGARE